MLRLSAIPRQISLSRLLLLCGAIAVCAAIIGGHVRNAQSVSSLATRINEANGSADLQYSRSHIPFLQTAAIVSVDLAGPHEPVDASLLREIASTKTVAEIRVDNRPIDGDAVLALSLSKSVTKLCLCNTGISDDDLLSLQPLKQLVHLDISENEITDLGIKALSGFSQLKSLSIASTDVSIEELSKLRIDSLASVDASYCPGHRLDMTSKGFGGMKSLTTLSVGNCDIDELRIGEPIKDSPLYSLNLRGAVVPLDGLAQGFPRLSELAVDSRSITLSSLSSLGNLEFLSTLIIQTNQQGLSLAMDDPGQTQAIVVQGNLIEISTDQHEEVNAAFKRLLEAHPGLKVRSSGKLTADLYDRRRVYGGVRFK